MVYVQSQILEFAGDALVDHPTAAFAKISPLLKWPGGKAGELPLILPALPPTMSRYIEPFLGGGAVFLSMPSHIPALINDASSDLVSFYECIRDEDRDFFSALEEMQQSWMYLEGFANEYAEWFWQHYTALKEGVHDGIDSNNKIDEFIEDNIIKVKNTLGPIFRDYPNIFITEMKRSIDNKFSRTIKIEKDTGVFSKRDLLLNVESLLKSAYYMYIRFLYNKYDVINKSKRAAIFFFIREYAYASMFGFNKKGQFNVPYGGITYNRKYLTSKIHQMKNEYLKVRFLNAVIENDDFYKFLQKNNVCQDDFIFLDPPYDSEFSDYDKNSFTKNDQFRLAKYLIDECPAKFMMIIKYTDYIASLYENENLNIRYFDKKYMWTIKERNNRDTIHLLITNY